MARTERLIAFYRQQIFVWKCFGDGLAFIYLDKYSVKHAYFETTSLEVRQSAGFIGGKAGLAGEISLLREALNNGVPAVLCDVTNTLRHGDLCLLGASDPVVIEVKSSESLNKRAQRQIENNDRLRSFLETDQADSFRGVGEVRRSAFATPEKNYITELNDCIQCAYRDGHCVMTPEDGLRYVAILGSKAPLDSLIGWEGRREIAFFSLNGAKMKAEWMPYLPFTLSIREANHLYDFIEGRLVLLVLADMDRLRELMTRSGWAVALSWESDFAVLMTRQDGARMALSRQFVGRIGFEFLSLRWVADIHHENIDAILAQVPPSDGSSASQLVPDEALWPRSPPPSPSPSRGRD
jgi:hypothetical protein